MPLPPLHILNLPLGCRIVKISLNYPQFEFKVSSLLIKEVMPQKLFDQPLTFKPISEMDTDHIQAVLGTQNIRNVIKNCMLKEMERR